MMTLPASNIELPSDEWVLDNFAVRPTRSVQSVCFKGMLTHKASKQYGAVCNDGQGGEAIFEWYSDDQEFKTLWDKFVADCGMTEEEVIQLFVEEMIQQQNFNSIIGTVVRTEGGDKIFRQSVEALRGQVEGQYWDKKTKNWVSLNG